MFLCIRVSACEWVGACVFLYVSMCTYTCASVYELMCEYMRAHYTRLPNNNKNISHVAFEQSC